MKYPLDYNEYNEAIRILSERGLLNPLLPLDWEDWTGNEQQCFYELVEYIVGPYERDLIAQEITGADDE